VWQLLLRYPLKLVGNLVKAVLVQPSVEATIKGIVKKALTGHGEEFQRPEKLENAASEILGFFKAHRLKPEKIAIDGLPGSGKSTLARILAEKTGFTWICFDHENIDGPRQYTDKESIYEHHRLLRTQPADSFDVLIYMDQSVDACKSRILKRGREALIIDVLDFEKLKEVGDKAFQACSGVTSARLSGGAIVKIRPSRGFRCYENLKKEAVKKGLTVKKMSKEELIHLILYGRPQKGLPAYLNVKALKEETISLALTTLERLGYDYLSHGKKQFHGRGRH
jgi:hypothetical protein